MNKDIFKLFTPADTNYSETDGDAYHCFGDIFDLANSFLTIEPMTHKKLQKLCYYAKAWYLALNDYNLIQEPFEAWVHGAVQPDLYAKYRSYGFQFIPMFDGDRTKLPEEFMSFAREVFHAYGELDGDQLEKLNHQEEPWIKARGNLKPWESCNRTISEDDMKSYYRKMLTENEK